LQIADCRFQIASHVTAFKLPAEVPNLKSPI
jgi:hypothetical protein